MASANETAIRSEIAKLRAAYPWPVGRSQTFYEALADLWPEDVEAGVLATLRDWAKVGCPTPGYVRERALAHRSGRAAPASKPQRGPVPWHEARTPLHQGEDGYMRDADDRYVLAASERVVPRDDGATAEPWVAFMWSARAIAKLGGPAMGTLAPFVELARADASDADFEALWQARRNTMAEGAMTAEQVNARLMRIVAEALKRDAA
jgi:hypothetical protein